MFVLFCTTTVAYSLIKTANPAIKQRWTTQKQQVTFNYERRTALFSAAEEKLELKADKSGTSSFLEGLLHRKVPSHEELDQTPENTTGYNLYLSTKSCLILENNNTICLIVTKWEPVNYNELTIGVPKESEFGEKRVSQSPESVKLLSSKGFCLYFDVSIYLHIYIRIVHV